MIKLERQFVGADIGVDRNDRNPERIEREPMQEEDRAIFEQQGNPRPASIAGGRVFRAQPVNLGLERAVFDSESFRRVGKSRRTGRLNRLVARAIRSRGVLEFHAQSHRREGLSLRRSVGSQNFHVSVQVAARVECGKRNFGDRARVVEHD